MAQFFKNNSAIPTLDAHFGPNGPPPGLMLVAGTAIAQKTAFVSQWFNVYTRYQASALYCHYEHSDPFGPTHLKHAFGQFEETLASPIARSDDHTDHCAYYCVNHEPPVSFTLVAQQLPDFRRALRRHQRSDVGLVIFDTLLQALHPGYQSGAKIEPAFIQKVHQWALDNDLFVLGTMDLHLPARQGATPPGDDFLDNTLASYLPLCLGAYVLELDRPKLTRFDNIEPMTMRYLDKNWKAKPPIRVDVFFNHQRRWFTDADSRNNQVQRLQLRKLAMSEQA
ncbi:MAG: hypothetical protein CML18_01445 [Pusillimonas sp.]|nr:hypothetical protein [Pusillimonas sp.]|tara:strand:+ start:40543 stop:41385 length:843 start_codon:yes stop_codon:yes gene_type:complete